MKELCKLMAATILLFITKEDKEHMRHALELHSRPGATDFDAMAPTLAKLIKDREAWILNYLQEFRLDWNYPIYSESAAIKYWDVRDYFYATRYFLTKNVF